jgi:hypothetical protein
MKTITEISKKTAFKTRKTTQKPKVNPADFAPVIFAFIIILLFAFQVKAQHFWLTTYEFPYGPKTGITLTKENCLFVGIENGVIKSCDEGNHFEISLKSSAVFTVFSTKEGKVLAGGSGKIFITDRSGQNWDSISIDSPYPVIRFVENSNQELFAVTSAYSDSLRNYVGSGVFFSDDKGVTWIPRNNGLGIYKSCGRIAIDRNNRLYVAASDYYKTGNGGLFISDNNGIDWKHIDVTIDGKNAINNHLQVGNTLGLSVSPEDSLNFSFSGTAINTYVEINLRKSIYDIEKDNFWKVYQVFNSNLWWDDRILFNIHFAKNGDWYSSNEGMRNSAATYYSKSKGQTWLKVDYGLGLNDHLIRTEQFFVENQEGKIFMVQWLDERIYWTDASILTSTKPIEESTKDLNLFPNPVNKYENFSIRLDNSNEICKITIYDSLGRKVISETALNSVHNMKAPVNSGIYYIEVTNNYSSKTASLLVK